MIEERKCLECGNLFYAERLEETVEGGNKRKFCSKRCRIIYGNHKRNRGNDWKERREVILLRDKTCVMCGDKERLQVHHIEPFSIARNNDFSNLVALCPTCHVKEDNRMIRFHKVSRKIIFYMQKLKTTPSQTE